MNFSHFLFPLFHFDSIQAYDEKVDENDILEVLDEVVMMLNLNK